MALLARTRRRALCLWQQEPLHLVALDQHQQPSILSCKIFMQEQLRGLPHWAAQQQEQGLSLLGHQAVMRMQGVHQEVLAHQQQTARVSRLCPLLPQQSRSAGRLSAWQSPSVLVPRVQQLRLLGCAALHVRDSCLWAAGTHPSVCWVGVQSTRAAHKRMQRAVTDHWGLQHWTSASSP
jgi:hypothetical protein